MATVKANIGAKLGDACPCAGCGGRLRVWKTRINFAVGMRIRYLHCDECGHLPEHNKVMVPLEHAPARSINRP